MSDAGRAYEHYRWAKRYSRRGMIEKAHAHMARAMHYGHSDIVAPNRPSESGDIGMGRSEKKAPISRNPVARVTSAPVPHRGASLTALRGGCSRSALVKAINEEGDVLPHLKREIGVEIRAREIGERGGLSAFLTNNGCSMDIEPEYVCVVVALPGEPPIALLLLEPNERCLYITYLCVARERRGEGWGVFLGFLAAYFGIQCGVHQVYSNGISKQMTTTDYTRVGGTNEIALSQHMQITKLGFVDLWKQDGYSEETLTAMQEYCDGTPETSLDLRSGNLQLYEAYKESLLRDAKGVFSRFLRRSPTRQRHKQANKQTNNKARAPREDFWGVNHGS